MREYRKTHKFTGEAKARANARNYLNMYIRRLKILKQPCEVCGGLNVKAYQEDYSKPLQVRWLCVEHLAAHERLIVLHGPAVQPQIGDCFSAGSD